MAAAPDRRWVPDGHAFLDAVAEQPATFSQLSCLPVPFLLQAAISLGRGAPGAIKAIHEKLGFGALSELSGWAAFTAYALAVAAATTRLLATGRPNACCHPPSIAKRAKDISEGVPNGQWSELYFTSAADLTKLYSLLNGEGVQLACGFAPPTASGLPRCAGKLLKLRVLLEFCQLHRKAPAARAGRHPERFTVACPEGAWWGDSKQWRAMHALLYPGVAVPDWEH